MEGKDKEILGTCLSVILTKMVGFMLKGLRDRVIEQEADSLSFHTHAHKHTYSCTQVDKYSTYPSLHLCTYTLHVNTHGMFIKTQYHLMLLD